MIIDGRDFPGQPVHQGVYLPRGMVSLWDELQYVTTNPVEALLEPGYFNKLYQRVSPPDRIEIASFVDDEWRYASLSVIGNTFDVTVPGVGGVVSVRLVWRDDEAIPEAATSGFHPVHKGRGVYEVQDGDNVMVAAGLSRVEAERIAIEGPSKAEAA